MSGTEPKPSWQNWQSFRRPAEAQACASVWPTDEAAEKRLIARGVKL
ncbi:hypothetical protein CcrBL47_gp253c [Caulobacter phage BL47]|nr:hypothetical protein CcrBL47_gp253c [Caulobacter phage BL47]